DKARSQHYLTPCEENAVVNFVLHMDTLGQPIQIKYIPAIAFSATRHQPQADQPPKPPGVNWAKRLKRRRPELIARTKKPQDWNQLNIYDKVSH
ncbi:uncharacterized protein BDR25DRAFT_173852, partial [Lindgomyces ingoldianus]